MEEFGLKGQEAETMTGVFVRRNAESNCRLTAKEISAIVSAPDIKSRLPELGIVAEGDSSADFAAYVRQIAKWKRSSRTPRSI
jgi:hypothetical protein